MSDWRVVFLLVHLASTLLMAAPAYMLVIVNERGRFGAPLNYFTDNYMENIIRRNAGRCFVLQMTVLASGLGLIYFSGRSFASLVMEPTILIKLLALLTLVGLLSYIYFSLQPRIDAFINQVKPDQPAPADVGPKVGRLRMKRKKLSGLCFFLVLLALIMGLQATFGYNWYLAVIFVALAALYTWRVYRKGIPYAWI